jgi:hypothetical protein
MERTLNDAKNFYEIKIPSFDYLTTTNFNFTTTIGSNSLTFYFKWSSTTERWSGWVLMPDETIRLFGVIPNIINWSRYLDYSLILSFDGQNIGSEDLLDVTVVIVEWNL